MKKAIAIVDQDSELVELDKEFEGAKKEFDERMKFLQKQRDEAWDKTMGSVWKKIREVLKDNGQLTEFDPDTQFLRIEHGIIYLLEKKDLEDVPQIIKHLFRLD